jgi:hypothetical protein
MRSFAPQVPPRSERVLAESDIQRVILARASRIPGVFCYRVNVLLSKRPGRAVLSVIGPDGKLLRGHSDLLACVRGRYVGIEVKRPGGEQSDEQREFERLITEAGGIYMLSDSAPHVIASLRALAGLVADPEFQAR